MAFEGVSMAMIKMTAKWIGVKLVEGGAPRLDFACSHSRHSVHACSMDTVKMDGMRMGASVKKPDANPVPLHTAQRRTGYTTVECPGWEKYSWSDFNFLINRHDVVFSQHLAIWQGAYLPI